MDSWYFERGIDPLSAPISDFLELPFEQFETGKQYHTINTIRSALSMTHNDIDDTRVGQQPLISHFWKGVFNCQSPAHRYSTTWDAVVEITSGHWTIFGQLLHVYIQISWRTAAMSGKRRARVAHPQRNVL